MLKRHGWVLAVAMAAVAACTGPEILAGTAVTEELRERGAGVSGVRGPEDDSVRADSAGRYGGSIGGAD